MERRDGSRRFGLAATVLWLLGRVVVCLGANPDAVFQQAGGAEMAGKPGEARRLWREFLAARPEGEQAERVRHQLVPLETRDLGKNCRHYPVWSPDGRLLMYGYGGLAILELGTGQGISLEAPTGPLYNHDWSVDGVTVVARQPDATGRQSIFLFERQPDEALFPFGDGLPVCEGASAQFDVTGTKLMISAAAKSGLDTLINVSPSRLSLPYLLEELNKTVYDTAQRKFVMTFLAMKLDTRVGSLEFANAGHNFPLLLRSVNGKPEAQALIARGNRLGDVRNSRYQQIGCELLAGDLIFLYTDGLTEYRDPQGREYTERRLRRLLLSHCHLEPDAILSKVLSDLSEFAGNAPQEDDITIVVVRVGG